MRIRPADAISIVDALDLPDGAHFAMIEELTGMDACDAYGLPEAEERPNPCRGRQGKCPNSAKRGRTLCRKCAAEGAGK